MSINGEPGGEPTRIGVPVVDLVTGLNAVIGILLALAERHRSGRGQFVDVTLYDSGLSILHPHLANFFMSGKAPARSGNAHPNISPYDSFSTGSGQIFLAVGNDGQFAKFCTYIGQPQLTADARFLTNGDRTVNRAALRAELERLLSAHDASSLAEGLIRAGVPCAPVLEVAEAIAHPHALHRGMVVEMDGYRGTGAPIKLSRTPASYRLVPPAFGEHTQEVLGTDGSTVGEP